MVNNYVYFLLLKTKVWEQEKEDCANFPRKNNVSKKSNCITNPQHQQWSKLHCCHRLYTKLDVKLILEWDTTYSTMKQEQSGTWKGKVHKVFSDPPQQCTVLVIRKHPVMECTVNYSTQSTMQQSSIHYHKINLLSNHGKGKCTIHIYTTFQQQWLSSSVSET